MAVVFEIGKSQITQNVQAIQARLAAGLPTSGKPLTVIATAPKAAKAAKAKAEQDAPEAPAE